MAGEIFQVTHLTDHWVGEKTRGSQGLKWPKTHYGVVALLGEVKRDGSAQFDVDAAMAALGWQRIPPRAGTVQELSRASVTPSASAAQKDSSHV